MRIWALLVAALLCVPSSAPARHRYHDSDARPGEFDYYLLSLSWSPAFCLGSPGSAECSGSRRYGFIVHGLWPQNEQGWPQYCNVHVPVADETVQSIIDIMPARQLVYHEWSAHGTCSGLEPGAFFALVRRAYAGVRLPAQYSDISQPLQQSPESVTAAFSKANPGLAERSIVVTCSGSPCRACVRYTSVWIVTLDRGRVRLTRRARRAMRRLCLSRRSVDRRIFPDDAEHTFDRSRLRDGPGLQCGASGWRNRVSADQSRAGNGAAG